VLLAGAVAPPTARGQPASAKLRAMNCSNGFTSCYCCFHVASAGCQGSTWTLLMTCQGSGMRYAQRAWLTSEWAGGGWGWRCGRLRAATAQKSKHSSMAVGRVTCREPC
jgi:hypothetical protein